MPNDEKIKVSVVQEALRQIEFRITGVQRSANRAGAVYRKGNKIIDELFYEAFEGPESYASINYDQYGVLAGMIYILLHEIVHVSPLGQIYQADQTQNYRERTHRAPSGLEWENSREFSRIEADTNGVARSLGLGIGYDFGIWENARPRHGWGAGW